MLIRQLAMLLVSYFTTTFILCCTVFAEVKPVPPDLSEKGFLVGQFKKKDKTPLADGRLFIYFKDLGPPSSDRYVRVPDQVEGLDKDGRFSLELPVGEYYLSAIKTPEDGLPGPPADGESVYFKMDSKGKILSHIVSAGKKNDVGVISSSSPFKRKMNSYKAGDTIVEGIVVDANGVPVNGAIVLVSQILGIQNMAVYVSEKTASDGKFTLRFIDGGTYYLRVRSEFHGGMPMEGEIVNMNDPKEQLAVTVNKGEKLTGVRIQAKRQSKRGVRN